MLKINGYSFPIKFEEVHFRQRNYNGKSYITFNLINEFFPIFANDNIVYGGVDIKVDIEELKSINDLINQKYQGKIGSINISVNNDGIWETNIIEDFTIKFTKRNDKKISFEIKGKDFEYKSNATMVSLLTTTPEKEKISKKFDLSDFYDKVTTREIGKSTITKYFIK